MSEWIKWTRCKKPSKYLVTDGQSIHIVNSEIYGQTIPIVNSQRLGSNHVFSGVTHWAPVPSLPKNKKITRYAVVFNCKYSGYTFEQKLFEKKEDAHKLAQELRDEWPEMPHFVAEINWEE